MLTPEEQSRWNRVMNDFRQTRPRREADPTIAKLAEEAERESTKVRVYSERTYRIEELTEEDRKRLGLA